MTNRCEPPIPLPPKDPILTSIQIDRICKTLGEGAFGRVTECYDGKRNKKCAIKIIKALDSYRQEAKHELRVLATLSANDPNNYNKCVHLRHCFDFRNHICIVTDLLGESLYDFLCNNECVPFPASHIQNIARQIFISIACKLFGIVPLRIYDQISPC